MYRYCLLLFLVVTKLHAASRCEDALVHWSAQGQLAPHRLLRLYRNEDAFATWLDAQAISANSVEMYDRMANGMELPPETFDRLLIEDFSAQNVALKTAPRPPESVTLKGFLRSHSKFSKREGRGAIEVNSEYARRVARLRRGDQLEFTDLDFLLGDYLGQGNSTLIFAAGNDPSFAIRIPYLTSILSERGVRPEQPAQRFITSKPIPETGRVRVCRIGPNFEYTLVNRVHGSENGWEFIREHAGLQRSFEYFELIECGLDFESRDLREAAALAVREAAHIFDPQTRRKYFRLLVATRTFKKIPRQFLWDGSSWVLIDWK